jgi:hypothetical protein
MSRTRLLAGTVTIALTLLAARSEAQRPAALLEGHAGHAWFVDDSPIPHLVLGGGGRVYVTRRIAVGPELTWMRGPGIDRDWFLTGNATIDLVRNGAGRAVPYIIGGAGTQHTTIAVGTGRFSSTEGAFTAGAGVRVAPGGSWYFAPEFRLGWELHWRAGVSVGWRP